MKILTLSIGTIGLGLLVACQSSFSDSGEDHEGGFWQRTPGVAPVKNAVYQEECGSCHFAYPPGLLPARSWQAIMTGLDDHFGDNAELSPDRRQAIARYLSDNSADQAGGRRSRQLLRGLPDNVTPLRITELPHFRREHREVPARVLRNNPQLSSMSQCPACHGDAKQGYFSERRIAIPGYGGWDD
jgi:hypothetical protein